MSKGVIFVFVLIVTVMSYMAGRGDAMNLTSWWPQAIGMFFFGIIFTDMLLEPDKEEAVISLPPLPNPPAFDPLSLKGESHE